MVGVIGIGIVIVLVIAFLIGANKSNKDDIQKLNSTISSLEKELKDSDDQKREVQWQYDKLLGQFDKEHDRLVNIVGDDFDKTDVRLISKILDDRDKYYELHDKREEFLNEFLCNDNLQNIPYISSLVADYKTLDLKLMAWSLDYGDNQRRKDKVRKLNELRAEEKEYIKDYKAIQYQLDYLISIYPEIEDIISTSYSDIKEKPHADLGEEVDPIRYYISKEEYDNLSETEKNQLALDRYIESHRKSLWQIGRDYELYVGYEYEKHGFSVDYYGSVHGVEDLGRDLIATKRGKRTLIIQCKYWSKNKVIHEKHIAQLYGTYISYCIETKKSTDDVAPVFVTSTELSEQAKRFCEFLNVSYKENFELGEFPRIKCVNNTANGTKIYHLPMDLQYDSIRLDKPGRFSVMTVKEAEDQEYRRAYKFHGMGGELV